jgi:hypothetical protein
MTIEELNKEIFKLTLRITDTHPELSKYLTELHLTLPNNKKPMINQEALVEYRDCLLEFLNTYELKRVR